MRGGGKIFHSVSWQETVHDRVSGAPMEKRFHVDKVRNGEWRNFRRAR